MEEVVEEVVRAYKGRVEEFPDVIQGILGFLDVFRIIYKDKGLKERP